MRARSNIDLKEGPEDEPPMYIEDAPEEGGIDDYSGEYIYLTSLSCNCTKHNLNS